MRICVIGAGAMGGIFGGHLKRSGRDVTLIDLRRDHVEAIVRDGLRVDGVLGDHRIPVPAFVSPDDLGRFDVAIVFTDTNATTDAAHTAARLLAGDGFALTLQNGIGNVEKLNAVLGAERVIAGVTMDSGNFRGPGHVSYTNAGPVHLGEQTGAPSERVRRIVDALERAGFRPSATDNTFGEIWQKFALNCCVNAICAVTGLRTGEVARTPEVDAFQDRIIDEVFTVIAAKGVALPDSDVPDRIKEVCFRRYNKPSMLQHMERGQRTEIDAINGALVREAKALGIATPYNESLVAIVKGLERHRRQIHGPAIDYEALEAEAAREQRPRRGGAAGGS